MHVAKLFAPLFLMIASTSMAQGPQTPHVFDESYHPISSGDPIAAPNPQFARVLTHTLERVKSFEGSLPTAETAPPEKAIIDSYAYAAQQGNAIAQFKLGQLFLDGELLEQNNRKALTWFTASAEQGLIQAQLLLSSMYLQGIGTDKDLLMARKWFEIAISLSERIEELQFNEIQNTAVF